MKNRKLQAFYLGLAGAFLFSISYKLPGSAILFSICFIFMMELTYAFRRGADFSSIKERIVNNYLRLLILAFVLLPGGVFAGSALGFLQGPYDMYVSISIAFSILTVTLYFALIFSQSMLAPRESMPLAKLLDVLFISSTKNLNEILLLCMSGAALMIVSLYTKGIGLIITIPLMFLANIFYFEKFIEPHLLPESPKPVDVDSPVADGQ